MYKGEKELTVTARLDGSLNVADALHGDTVLVVAVDVLVLKLTNLVQQDTELVGNVGNILVTTLTPNGELLLIGSLVYHGRLSHSVVAKAVMTYSDIHALLGDGLQASHNVLLHLHELGKLLGQVRAEGTTGIAAQGMACYDEMNQ